MKKFVLFVGACIIATSSLLYSCKKEESVAIPERHSTLSLNSGRINPLDMGKFHNLVLDEIYSNGILNKDSGTIYSVGVLEGMERVSKSFFLSNGYDSTDVVTGLSFGKELYLTTPFLHNVTQINLENYSRIDSVFRVHGSKQLADDFLYIVEKALNHRDGCNSCKNEIISLTDSICSKNWKGNDKVIAEVFKSTIYSSEEYWPEVARPGGWRGTPLSKSSWVIIHDAIGAAYGTAAAGLVTPVAPIVGLFCGAAASVNIEEEWLL